jgi:hypothetical protein
MLIISRPSSGIHPAFSIESVKPWPLAYEVQDRLATLPQFEIIQGLRRYVPRIGNCYAARKQSRERTRELRSRHLFYKHPGNGQLQQEPVQGETPIIGAKPDIEA